MSSQTAPAAQALKSINPLERGAEQLLAQPSKGYWANIWDQLRVRPAVLFALWSFGVLVFFAIGAPLLANHRPYVAVDPIVDEQGAIVGSEVSFPLFVSLGVVDWALIAGGVVAVWLYFWRKSIVRRKGRSGPIALALYLLAVVGILVVSLVMTPWERARDLQPAWWWASFSACIVIGLGMVFWGAWIVGTARRDAFGRDLTTGALRLLFFGSFIASVGAGAFVSLNRPALDRTDYFREYQVNPEEGAWAIFPPIPHNYIGSEPYAESQPPLSPTLRVISSGGSQAPADLAIDTASRRDGRTLAQGYQGTLSLETPLAELNNGAGVELHPSGRNDLIIITHDLEGTRVRLRGAETLGDVIEGLNKAAVVRRTGDTKFVASLDPATGIVFEDQTLRRPLHLMGTEKSGADVTARLLLATRVALSIGFVSTGIATLVGIAFGAVIGYFGGWVDHLGMRIIEIFMAIPRLFLLLTIIAFIPPQYNQYMLYAMMVVIGLTSWMPSARFIRAEFFRLRETDYVQAAKACGLPLRSILFKHMLPNGVTPVLVSASFGVAAAIFVETGLSFLGFGIKPPDPSWGQMLNEAIDPSTGVFNWWLAIFPGILIFITVFSFNIIGDALRDAIDPRLKKASAI